MRPRRLLPPLLPIRWLEITSVLHGVNLTALVDGYYQYNANQPVAGTYTEPFTNVNSQFQLNLLEVQLDKPVVRAARSDSASPLVSAMR